MWQHVAANSLVCQSLLPQLRRSCQPTDCNFVLPCACCLAACQVPVLFDKEEVHERLRKLPGGPTQPLTIHLRQEIDRLNIIVRLTTTTLQNLRLAIAGTIALSGNLIEALDALFMARIPAAWLKKSWEVGVLCRWATLVGWLWLAH